MCCASHSFALVAIDNEFICALIDRQQLMHELV